MTTRNLDALFEPKAIALVGASNQAGSVGAVLARNLFENGFAGPILAVNPHELSIRSALSYHTIAELPVTPDLAVVATPPPAVPGLIAELGQRGCRAAVVVTASGGACVHRAASRDQENSDYLLHCCMLLSRPLSAAAPKGCVSEKPSLFEVFRSRRMAVLFGLGFSSGLPLMLTGQTLQAWAKDAGVDIKKIAALSLVGLAYTFKFAWAPLLDRYRLPMLGRRRGWALTDQELALGIRSIAVPVRNRSGRVTAALNVTVHAAGTPISVLIETYLPLLQQTAATIEKDWSLRAAIPHVDIAPGRPQPAAGSAPPGA